MNYWCDRCIDLAWLCLVIWCGFGIHDFNFAQRVCSPYFNLGARGCVGLKKEHALRTRAFIRIIKEPYCSVECWIICIHSSYTNVKAKVYVIVQGRSKESDNQANYESGAGSRYYNWIDSFRSTSCYLTISILTLAYCRTCGCSLRIRILPDRAR